MFPTEGRMQWRIFCTNILIFKEPFCTSYDKYEMDNSDSNDIDIIKKLSEDYWNYKGYFTFPEMYKGNLISYCTKNK